MHHPLKRRVARLPRLGFSASALALALAGFQPVQAQEVGAGVAALEADEPIVVTGSRLRRTDLTATSPVNVVSDEAIKMSGNGTIEQTLNELPQLKGQGGATAGNTNAAGIYTADLRGLGAARTLVLVNGRRFVPANTDLLVDLSTIPEALIKRADVVTGGASAVYGSDAVAGVVNFILDDTFEGIRANYSYAITERGDGERHKADLTFGGNFADGRGHVVANLAYSNQSLISAADRGFSKTALVESGDTLIPGGAVQIPGSYVALSSAQRARIVGLDFANAGCDATGLRFEEGGAAQIFCNPEDQYNYGADNLLMRPQTRYQLSVIGKYEISDSVEAYAEGFFVRNENSYQIAPVAFTAQNGTSGRLAIPNVSTNPALSDATRNFFMANAWLFDPDRDGNYSVTNVRTRPIELGPRWYDFERDSFQGTAGLRGDVTIGGGKWTWDGYYSYQALHQFRAAYGTVSTERLALGLDAMIDPVTGDAVCRNQILGCVPVNIFGVNSVSPEAAAFISPVATSTNDATRQMMAFNANGPLFHLPAGPVSVALGVEYRKESFSFNPDAQVASGQLSAGVPNPPNSGSLDVFEQYGEINVPILAEKPFFHMLSFEGAVRFSDYSTIGTTLAYKAGGQWAPIPWLRVRGAYQRSVRAPSLDDLFANVTSGSSAYNDPCAAVRSPSAAVKTLCVAQGVPAADIDSFTQVSTTTNVRSGGNPGLQEEKSDTYTIGFVMSPPMVPGLNVTVDFYDISVNNAISTVNAQGTMNLCFDALDSSNPFCQRIHRFPNGDIQTIETTLMNVAKRKVRGIDFQVDYSLPLPSAVALGGEDARLNIKLAGNRQFRDTTIAQPDAEPINCTGKFGGSCTGVGTWVSPAFKAQMSATYLSGPLSVTARGRYIGAIHLLEGVTAYRDRFGGEGYLDLSMRYKLTSNVQVYGGVNNALDNKPPLMGINLGGPVNTSEATYDVIGRRYFMGAEVTF